MRLSTQASWLVVTMVACSTALAALGGRPVSAVLEGLKPQGLVFIYNSEILPARLLVDAEPRARTGLDLAKEVLSSHGLELLPIAPGIYSVVPAAPEAPVPARAPAPTRQLEEVVVQTSRYTLTDEAATSYAFLNQQQLRNTPRLADEPLRALQRLPGVATNGFSSFGSVRGGVSSETTIVLDGLRLYEPFHLKNFLAPVSLLDSQVIDSLEFYSGGFPTIYGDSLSGVVDARTIHPEQPKYFELGLDVFHTSGLAALQLTDNTRGLIAVRRSNLRELASFSEDDFGDIQYDDGLARVEHQFDTDTKGSVQTLVAEDEIIARRAGNTQEVRARYRNVYAWATLDHAWSMTASSRVIASFTTLDNERHGVVNDPEQRTGRVLDERHFDIAGLRIDNELQTGFAQQRFGMELRHLTGSYDYLNALSTAPMFPFPSSAAMDSSQVSALRPSGYESTAYWDVLADVDAHWTVQGGLRGDLQSYAGTDRDSQLSPRLSVLYRATPQTQWRASWGRFFQSQGINELQVEDGIYSRHAAPYADHTILALEHAFGSGDTLRVEAYRKDYHQLSARFENLFDPLVLFPEVEVDRVRVDAKRARATGIELMLQLHARGAWSGSFNYSWARSEDKIDGNYVSRSFEQRQAVNVGALWSKGGWTVTLANSFHTGTPTTPFALLLGPSGPAIDSRSRNTARLDHYNSLDLRVTRAFPLSYGKLEAFFEVTNTLNRDNPCCVEYTVSEGTGGALDTSRQVESLLPRVPTLGLSWHFE